MGKWKGNRKTSVKKKGKMKEKKDEIEFERKDGRKENS